MTSSGILQGKRAVVFGAGASIGAAVAKEFAAEGAEVYLSGRNKTNVEEVKRAIEGAGGKAHASVVDALDDEAVGKYLEEWWQRQAASTSSSILWALERLTTGAENRRST